MIDRMHRPDRGSEYRSLRQPALLPEPRKALQRDPPASRWQTPYRHMAGNILWRRPVSVGF